MEGKTMNTETLLAVIQQLSEKFGVDVPTMTINRRRSISCYKPKYKRIELEKNILDQAWAFSTVVHEFAHHLDFTRQPSHTRRGRMHHDRVFMGCLLECVTVAYSSRDEYFWHKEYRSIQNRFPGYVIASKKKFDDRVAAAVKKWENVA